MVYHILKDGSRPQDISGKVVKVSEAKNLYEVISGINKRSKNERKNT